MDSPLEGRARNDVHAGGSVHRTSLHPLRSIRERSPMKRIQRSRAKGWRLPAGAIIVSRPSLWGNPWAIRDAAAWNIPAADRAAWAVRMYREELTHFGLLSDWDYYASEATFAKVARAIDESGVRNMAEYAGIVLRGHDLCCWCPLDQPCHADALLELSNQ